MGSEPCPPGVLAGSKEVARIKCEWREAPFSGHWHGAILSPGDNEESYKLLDSIMEAEGSEKLDCVADDMMAAGTHPRPARRGTP